MSSPRQDRKNVAGSSIARQNAFRYYECSRLQDPRRYVRLLKASRNPTQGSHAYELEIFPTDILFDRPGKLTYYAVSYEWGSPSSPTENIIVNSRLLSIRQNLYEFLEEIQKKILAGTFSRDYWLWIDAICIDQSNIEEKACQVPLMQHIFSYASFVFAWLGRRGCFDARSFKKHILTVARETDERWFSYLDTTDESNDFVTSSKQQEELEKVAGLLHNADFYTELEVTLSLSFWSRRWILQEIALAWSVVVVFGEEEIRWSDMKKLFCMLRLHFQHRDNPLRQFHAWRLWELGNSNLIQRAPRIDYIHQLKTILMALVGSECELDVDRIYVVLNLMSSQSSNGPDYTTSASQLFCSIYAKGADFDLESLLLGVSPNPSKNTEFKQRARDWLVVAEELRLVSPDQAGSFQISVPDSTSIVRYSQSMEYVNDILLRNEAQLYPASEELTVTIQSTGLGRILPASTVSVQIGEVKCVHHTTCSASSVHQISIRWDNGRGDPSKVRHISSIETEEDPLYQASVDRTMIRYRLCGRDTVDPLVNVTIECRDKPGVTNECSVKQGSMKCEAGPSQPLYVPRVIKPKLWKRRVHQVVLPFTVDVNICSADLLDRLISLSAEPGVVKELETTIESLPVADLNLREDETSL